MNWRDKFTNFMYGRYGQNGPDGFYRFLVGAALVCVIANIFVKNNILSYVAWFFLIYAIFRMLSKNHQARYAENQKYLDTVRNIKNRFAKTKRRAAQSKDFHIYKCPSCGQKMRAPRKKGRIRVQCHNCGNNFEKKV